MGQPTLRNFCGTIRILHYALVREITPRRIRQAARQKTIRDYWLYERRDVAIFIRRKLLFTRNTLLPMSRDEFYRRRAMLYLHELDNHIGMHTYAHKNLISSIPYGAKDPEFIAYAEQLALPNIHGLLRKATDNRLSSAPQPC